MQLSRPLATVTPTLDGDVLSVLARTDVAFTTGQVHRVMPTKSEDGVRRVLQRLSAQGVVRSDRVGNAYTYRLNRDHLAAEHIVGLANLFSTFLDRLSELLDGWSPKPSYAAVFGSAAVGTMTSGSDIDLLLIRPGAADDETWDAQVHALVESVARWTGNDVRPLVLDEADVSPGETVLREVLERGLTVAGTHDWLARRLRKTKAPA
jgi:predicted transcriptional regulator